MSKAITEERVRECLRQVKYPGFSRNIVSFGLVRQIAVDDRGNVDLHLVLTTKDPEVPEKLQAAVREAMSRLDGLGEVSLRLSLEGTADGPGAAPAVQQATRIEGIRHIVAVGSGKGGVGKSTVAANLALALAKHGWRTALCDCDIYGPSAGIMFGINERPYATSDNKILPFERYDIRIMTMSAFLDGDSPAVLRGPMVTRYTQQFLRQVEWGERDILILDLPPGTGDIQLTIVQTVALTGAVIVTTPQEVALIDARKAAAMFAKVNVPVLGLVENMSYFECPSDGIRYPIFGEGGGAREADRLGVPLLGKVPIDIPTREASDAGLPVVAKGAGTGSAASVFLDMAHTLQQTLIGRLPGNP